MQSFSSYLFQLILLTISLLCSGGCTSNSAFQSTLQMPTGLSIDEYALKEAPQSEPLTFVPVQGSQREILAKHQQERHAHFPDKSYDHNGQFGLSTTFGERELVATYIFADTGSTIGGTSQKVAIQVLLADKVIYTISAGDSSPISSIRGLWVDDNHWILEIANVTQTRTSQNEVTWDAVGQIIQDGRLLNEQYGYQEMFGFQLMRGKPFYFFKEDGQIGISYDNQTALLEYEFIPHYGCCSASELNPISAQNMVAFFAQRDGIWYYVEIGAYG